jgi:hypothetical protein
MRLLFTARGSLRAIMGESAGLTKPAALRERTQAL